MIVIYPRFLWSSYSEFCIEQVSVIDGSQLWSYVAPLVFDVSRLSALSLGEYAMIYN